MSQSLTLRVGDEFVIEVSALVGKTKVGVTRTVASDDAAKVAVEAIDEFRFLLKAIAVGSATITARLRALDSSLRLIPPFLPRADAIQPSCDRRWLIFCKWCLLMWKCLERNSREIRAFAGWLHR